MTIYTRKGDDGGTRLLGDKRRWSKGSDRVAALGAVDAANAALGWAVSVLDHETGGQERGVASGTERFRDLVERLALVQRDLFVLGSHVAVPPQAPDAKPPKIPTLPLERISEMERWIDQADEELPPLSRFILPGGSPGAAALHVARTVCREAERAVARLGEKHDTEPAKGSTVADRQSIRYLNRLSDLLFAMARLANHRTGVEDVVWRQLPLV